MLRQLFKPLLLCLLLCITSAACFGQFQYYNNIKAWHINGRVDSIVQLHFTIKRDSIETRRLNSKSVSFFDKNGFLTNHSTATDNGPLKSIYFYGDKGLTEMVRYSVKGVAYAKEVYTFDPLKSLAESRNYNLPSNQLTVTVKMLLDKKGNILEIYSTNIAGQVFYKQQYKYNDEGYCIEEIEFRPAVLKEAKALRTFDNDGNVVKQTNYNFSGELSSTHDYTYTGYDEHHNWITQKIYINGKFSQILERTITYRK